MGMINIFNSDKSSLPKSEKFGKLERILNSKEKIEDE